MITNPKNAWGDCKSGPLLNLYFDQSFTVKATAASPALHGSKKLKLSLCYLAQQSQQCNMFSSSTVGLGCQGRGTPWDQFNL